MRQSKREPFLTRDIAKVNNCECPFIYKLIIQLWSKAVIKQVQHLNIPIADMALK